MLTKVMALELAPHGVTVNSVAPGHIATPMNGFPVPATAPRAGIPVGRIGLPDEVAAAIVHLVTAAAAYTTGCSLVVDGGLLLMPVGILQDELAAVPGG
jgi:NAD(P)-dependent dehydrogenase (short-subunit alcohol dehydrogenase family)